MESNVKKLKKKKTHNFLNKFDLYFVSNLISLLITLCMFFRDELRPVLHAKRATGRR